MAPIKAGVFPLVKKDGMPELATTLYHDFKRQFTCFYDDSGAIGRRYRRMDEAGTPFGITVDGETTAGAHGHRAAPGFDAAGAGGRGSGGGVHQRRGSVSGSCSDRMRLSDFEAMVRRLSDEVPPHFFDGIAEVMVSPRTVPHPDRAEIFTLGECIPLPVRLAGQRGCRAGSCSITARLLPGPDCRTDSTGGWRPGRR